MEGWVKRVAIIWTGQALSIFSTVAASFAAIWYITVTTESPLVLSLAGIATLLPVGLLSPFGGVAADRFNRKHLMMLADGMAGAFSLVLAITVLVSGASVPLLLALLALRASAQAFHGPALAAAMPQMVPEDQVMRINSMDQAVTSLASIAGPVLGIFLYSTFGFAAVMLLDACCAAFACLCMGMVELPDYERSQASGSGVKGVLVDLKDGVGLVVGNKGLRSLMVLVMVSMLLFLPLAVLSPMMTYDLFHGDGYQASLVEAVYGFALLAGSVAVMAWGGGKGRKAPIIIVSGLIMGVALTLCGFLQEGQFPLYVVLIGISALMVGFYNAPLLPIIMANVPESSSGRAMSIFMTGSALASPVGLGISGFATQFVGVPLWFAVCGGLLVAVHVLANLSPAIRNLEG